MDEMLPSFIDHEFSQGAGPAAELRDPRDGSLLARWNCAEEMEVIRCLQSAKKFLSAPQGWPQAERFQALQRMHNLITQRSAEWSAAEARQQNLPQNFVLENSFRHALRLLEKSHFATPEGYSLAPTGVVAIITGWGLSFRLVMESLIPALAAGNAVIVKVSSRSPVTAKILGELALAAELPRGSLQVLLGEGCRVGAFLAAHPGVRAVSFVGKTKNAEAVIRSTATQFKKLKIRGGQKNAALVLPGYRDEDVPEIVKSFTLGDGRLGWSMSRLLTTEAEAPALLEKLKTALQKIDGPAAISDSRTQIETRAQGEHAKIIFERAASFLIDLPNCSDLQQEEIGVPVFPIVTVKYLHELAKWANNTSYGNLATLWGDDEKARKLSDKLEFGGLWFNHWLRAQDESPWGLKQSAFGIGDAQAEGPFYSDRKMTL